MVSLQLRPLHSTTVTIDRHPNGYGVSLAGEHLGSFELYPVWGLSGRQEDTARAMGLDVADDCYICNGQVFITQAQAAAQLVADYLASTARWEMPDYI
jgi:hypothetical protein